MTGSILSFFIATFLLIFSLAAKAVIEPGAPLVGLVAGNHEPVAKLKRVKSVLGMIPAGSTFQSTGEKSGTVNTIGSATVVQLENGQTTVLTAAHVVAGEKPWVKVNGKVIQIKQLLLDNDADIAILELGKIKITPALSFRNNQLKIAAKFMQAINAAKIPTVMLAYYLPHRALGFALQPWVDPGVETAFTRAVVNAPIASLNYDGSQVRIHTKVTSGASGSAVLDFREQTVAGLIVQSHYYFSETYLASPRVLIAHYQKFLSGQRGVTSQTVWKMQNQLAFRIFPDQVEETNFVHRPTGGVIGQPGAGIIGQPGHGVIGQPGHGVIGQPSSQNEKIFLPWTEDPRAVFSYFQIQPGMAWKGQPVIGLKVHAKKRIEPWPLDFNLLAETEAFRFMRENQGNFEFTAIPLHVDYLGLLRQRLGITDSLEHKIKATFGPSAVADDFELEPQPEACILTVTSEQVRVHVKTYSHMDRKTWKLSEDEIEFSLGRNGAEAGRDEFLPIIETRGLKSGEVYYVDLRKFFFSDLSQIIRPLSNWSTANAPLDQSRFEVSKQMRTIGFSVRNGASGAEFSYGF